MRRVVMLAATIRRRQGIRRDECGDEGVEDDAWVE
jgi:hypothetical protein